MNIDAHTDFDQTNVVWSWVKEENSFSFKKVALNNALSGDTDSIMLSMKALAIQNAEEAIAIADEIGAITNDAFPEYVKHAFNCPDDRLDSIQTDREVVADKALFLSKKRYIMHIVNDEGKDVDKLKIMGVEIKKSSTPIIVKKFLLELVHMILDEVGVTVINQRVDEMKREYPTYDIKEIAQPISCNGLKKYQDVYEKTGSLKGAPYQVRAAIFYNENCSLMDKKIVPGDKIGVVYIKHPKSKYIAFPIDSNSFPTFFDDLVIDWDVQWSKVYKKLEAYMSSVGFDIKGRKAAVRKNLFGL